MPQAPIFDPLKERRNFHQTYAHFQQGTWDLYFPGYNSIADYQETTRQLQGIIAAAKASGTPLRAVGSHWSLSKAPATSGWTINTNRLRGSMHISAPTVDPGFKGNADQRDGMYLIQCGNSVADVNAMLENVSRRRALFTSGAANGQTFVGAASTGTHGSALGRGALHDHIVAIHLVTTASEHVWLERKTWPVMHPLWVSHLGAALLRDDELFNGALVAFGSFGIVESVVIESVPRYWLRAQPGQAALDDDLWAAIAELDFSRHAFFKEHGQNPYFFQAIVNPAGGDVLLNANYAETCPAGEIPTYGLTQNPKAIGPGFDSLSAVGMILDVFKGVIPPLSKVVAKNLFDLSKRTGTPGQIYGYKAPQLHVASGSIAVDLGDARRTLALLIDLYGDVGPVPLVFGCRYVARSPALLAFNKFGTGLMISIDGIDNQSSRAFFQAAAERLETAKIDFTQHWGKTNAYTYDRVRKAYGQNVYRWLTARERLLPSAADRALFNNDYIRERGLVR